MENAFVNNYWRAREDRQKTIDALVRADMRRLSTPDYKPEDNPPDFIHPARWRALWNWYSREE